MGNSTDRIASRPGLAGGSVALFHDLAAFAGRTIAATAACVAAGAVLEGVGLALIVPLLAVVIAPAAPSGRLEHVAAAAFATLGVETATGRLALLIAMLIAVVALRAVVVAARDLRVARLQISFAESLRLRLAARLAAASWAQVMRLRHARITQLMSAEIASVGAAAGLLLRAGVAVAMLVVQTILLLLLAPLLTLVVAVLLAIGALLFVPLIRRAHGVGQVVARGNLSLLDTTSQFLGGLKLAVSQNLQPGFLAEFRSTIGNLSRRQIDFARRQTRTRAIFSVLTTLAAGLLMLAAFGLFHASPPTLIAIVVVVGRMSGPAMQIQQSAQQLARLLPAYESMRALDDELAGLANVPARTGGGAVPDGAIVFEDVGYRHGDNAAGITGLDVRIAPAEFVGVTGPSGAGKTTFADLLSGLLSPQSGLISVGGVPLTAAALDGWRTRIAYVAQDAFLFHDSVRRNLAWMAPQATEEEMWQALELVDAADLVRRMERGLDTIVGERGSLVSGGERQRLALARAILRQPRVLILDEATSAIDADGERAILARLAARVPRPAIVLIAHRAESLALCDRVLTLADGRLVGERRPLC